MLRAASSRRVAASTGRFASQPESASPLFRATARRSSLLSQLRESPFKRKYIEEEEEEMKIKPAVWISDGNLVIKDRTILIGLPDNVITASASEAGPVEEVFVGSWLVSGSSFGGWPVFTLLYSQLAMVMNDEFQASLLMLLLRYKMTGQDSSSNNVNKLFMETMVARLEQMMIKHGEELHQRIDQSQGKAKPRRNMEKNENSDQRQTITDDDDDATSSLSNPRRHSNHGDNDMKGMKLKIPPFHGKNDPDAYLEWEKNRQGYMEEEQLSLPPSSPLICLFRYYYHCYYYNRLLDSILLLFYLSQGVDFFVFANFGDYTFAFELCLF